MRAIPFANAFDLVLLVDAFGYFDDEQDDAIILAQIHRSLRHDGHVVMRNPNATPIRSAFRAHDEEQRGGVRTVIRRVLEDDGRIVREQLRIEDERATRTFERCARIYSATELDDVLTASGFAVQGHYAKPTGEHFDAEASPRIITVARKT